MSRLPGALGPDNPPAGLDNPIWTALTTRHRALAEGGAKARRYPAAITLLAAVPAPDRDAFGELRRLLPPGERAVLFLDAPLEGNAAGRVVETDRATQMVCADPPTARAAPSILGPADLPEMLALTARTQPGPFGPRTPELGLYVGLRVDGTLAAMAGERMRLPGLTEVSAVCTAPEFRGQGLAGALVAHLAQTIHARGETALLHVRSGNLAAIRVYQSLGFAVRREFHMAVVTGDPPELKSGPSHT